MKIKLLNHRSKKTFCKIPDNTEEIVINVISGDMVMINPIKRDSSKDRIINFYEGTVIIPKDKFDALNSIKNSYDVFEL